MKKGNVSFTLIESETELLTLMEKKTLGWLMAAPLAVFALWGFVALFGWSALGVFALSTLLGLCITVYVLVMVSLIVS